MGPEAPGNRQGGLEELGVLGSHEGVDGVEAVVVALLEALQELREAGCGLLGPGEGREPGAAGTGRSPGRRRSSSSGLCLDVLVVGGDRLPGPRKKGRHLQRGLGLLCIGNNNIPHQHACVFQGPEEVASPKINPN